MQNSKSVDLMEIQAEKSKKLNQTNVASNLNEQIYINDILKNDSNKINYDKYNKSNLNLSNFAETQQINVCIEDKNIENAPSNIINSQNLIALLSITNDSIANLDHQIVYKLEPQIAIEERENSFFEIGQSLPKETNTCNEIKYKNSMSKYILLRLFSDNLCVDKKY